LVTGVELGLYWLKYHCFAGLNNKRRPMNRSSKGFGLTGVAVAVVLMFVTAVFSTSAKSAEAPTTLSVLSSVK